MARLFYPTLFCVTAALAAALWAREGWPVDWLRAFDATLAQAQATDPPPPRGDVTSRTRALDTATNGAASRSPSPNANQRTGGAPPNNAGSQAGGFHRSAAPPSGARLRISAPDVARGDGQAEGEPIVMESTKLIARIGGNEHILLGDVMADVQKEFEQLARRYPPEQHQKLLEHLILKQVRGQIPIKVLLAEVRRKVPKEELEKTWKQLEIIFDRSYLQTALKENKVASAEAYDAMLKAGGSSLEKLKQQFVELQLAQQFWNDHAKVDEQVHPEELHAYYLAHYEKYKFSAKVRWEQLLVKFAGRSKREAYDLIADMGNQVRNGAPWDAVAKARSEGITAAKGGAWEWTNKGSMKSKALDDALFTLPLGTMSQIIEDERSFQIVRVIERTEAGAIPFEEKQREIKKLIVDERIKKKKNDYLQELVKEYKPQIWTIFDQAAEEAEKRQQMTRKPGDLGPR